MTISITELAGQLRGLLPQDGKVFPLHEPSIGTAEKEHVLACLDSTFVSSVGAYVDRFEEELKALCQLPHAVATVNGTSALHLCLLAVGVGRDDEVMVPSLSFVATSNAVAYTGATPHFVDCEAESLGVCPDKLKSYLADFDKDEKGNCVNRETGRVVRALVVMHTFGYIGKMEQLKKICREAGLKLIEDAAESLGSRRDGHPAGYWGDCSALSFNGNKIITTGGGGAVVCRDDEMASSLRHLSTTAKVPHPWKYEHDAVGFNFRMPNLNAALGVAQLERLSDFLNRKTGLHQKYVEAFNETAEVEILSPKTGQRANHWLNAMILHGSLSDRRDDVLEAFHALGILARPVWEPCHQLEMYKNSPSMDLTLTEDLAGRIINLPSSPALLF